MEQLNIQIPEGKEIDWEASAKQKQIVLKDKQPTYKDVCKELFKNSHYFVDNMGGIYEINMPAYNSNAATSEHQLECILAKNKLANVARYLNGDWCTVNFEGSSKWVIFINAQFNALGIRETKLFSEQVNVIFKSKELAQQAIKILGEETIRLALEPLY